MANLKLHLGCGNDYRNGYINIDSSDDVKSDLVWNLEETPLPYDNDLFQEIQANHVLEHIVDFIPLIHELHRIGAPGALLFIRVPFYSSWGQFNDPTHVRFFTPWTFSYFNVGRYSHEVNSKRNMFRVNKIILNFGVTIVIFFLVLILF